MKRDAFLRAWTESVLGALDAAAGASSQAADARRGVDAERKGLRFRTVWISDVHLGTPDCQAAALLDFLRQVECSTLFLVGDIVDGRQLRRQWFWPRTHNDVVQKILRKARKGTRVIFVPGNHDGFARRCLGHDFGGIEIAEDWVHLTADGRRFWVTHGDLCDGAMQCAKWLAVLGDRMYGVALRLNRHLNSCRARLGLPCGSLARGPRHAVKGAVGHVAHFEQSVAREAHRRGVDGVVCGHIHHAELREIGGVVYANDGDWVDSLSALVEHTCGRLELIDWSTHPTAREQTPRSGAGPAAPPRVAAVAKTTSA